MDGKRILEAAKVCKDHVFCYKDGIRCKARTGNGRCGIAEPDAIITACDHVKAEERAKERAEIIGKVMEWLRDGGSGSLMRLLDELEQEGR